jgi:hypothetical protein
MNPQISMVSGAKGTDLKPVRALTVLAAIKEGRWKDAVTAIRDEYQRVLGESGDRDMAKKAVDDSKKQLPAALWCGEFSARGDDRLESLSHLLCADVDDVGAEKAAALVKELQKDPHVFGAFISPTGEGVKPIFQVGGSVERHADNFLAVKQHMAKTYGLEIDSSCKNLERLCFVSYDPEAWWNENATPLAPVAAAKKKRSANPVNNATPQISSRRQIVESLIGAVDWQSDDTGYCTCPGQHLHTGANGPRDCRVLLDGVPTIDCFHKSCAPKREGINHQLRSMIGKAEYRHVGNNGGGSVSVFDDPRPKVQLAGNSHLLSETAVELGRILASHDIYKRSGRVVTLDLEQNRIVPVKPQTFRTLVERYVTLYEFRRSGGTELIKLYKTISKDESEALLSSPQLLDQLRPLKKLNPVRLPVMRPKGAIELLPAGYDAASATYSLDPVRYDTDMELGAATQLLRGLYFEFEFPEPERSLAVALSSAMTLFALGLLPEHSLRPCFLNIANCEGAGKGTLAKVALVPILGRAQMGVKPAREEEMEKVLVTAIDEAWPAIVFDNVKNHISSPALESLLTSSHYRGRRLSRNESVEGPNNATVFITANGATISPDMRRRSLICEVVCSAEKPEDRKFKQSLEESPLLERRSEILAALWSLVMAWDNAGRPKPSRSNSSFTDWSTVIGGIVEHAGFACPLEPPKTETGGDTDARDMRVLMPLIAQELGGASFARVVELAKENGLFERAVPAEDALDHKQRSILGRMFARYADRMIGTHRLVIEGRGMNKIFRAVAVGGEEFFKSPPLNAPAETAAMEKEEM